MEVSGGTDQPVPMRSGEELDLSALSVYLQKLFPDQPPAELQVLQFPSGHSNLTYLLRLGPRELVLRRPPFGARIATAHDMGREYHILAHLAPSDLTGARSAGYPKVPRPIAYCEDLSVMGVPFYLMERLTGIVLRQAQPQGLELSPVRMRTLSENFLDNLLEIHRVDYRAVGLGDLGHPQGYVRRQVEGWTGRYQKARTDDLPEMERVAAWLADDQPAESGAALIHNDYKYDNLVLDAHDPTQITGVLDWEMATIGDPLMDLGTSLGYWIDPDDPPQMQALAFSLTALPGNLTRRQLAERYARSSGQDLARLDFYYAYALFKIAVIAQQIYTRYQAGFTRDARFAGLIFAVQALARRAEQVIQTGRIDP